MYNSILKLYYVIYFRSFKLISWNIRPTGPLKIILIFYYSVTILILWFQGFCTLYKDHVTHALTPFRTNIFWMWTYKTTTLQPLTLSYVIRLFTYKINDRRLIALKIEAKFSFICQDIRPVSLLCIFIIYSIMKWDQINNILSILLLGLLFRSWWCCS